MIKANDFELTNVPCAGCGKNRLDDYKNTSNNSIGSKDLDYCECGSNNYKEMTFILPNKEIK